MLCSCKRMAFMEDWVETSVRGTGARGLGLGSGRGGILAWAPALLVGGGLLCDMWLVEGVAGEGHKQKDGRRSGGQRRGGLREILFGYSKSAPEAHYRCPQEAGRGEGAQIPLAEN